LKISFDNSYTRLPDKFFKKSRPTPVKNPKLIAFNSELATELNISFSDDSVESEVCSYFAGNRIVESSEPISIPYAGHQFGYFVPLLGDGRAILLGEVLAKNGKRYDVQLKGAGITDFSRRGDGRSAIGPVLREYIVSEFMHKLDVPTTRALCAVATGEMVYRDSILPGAVFTRVSESLIRVGTFEYFAHLEDKNSLKILLDYFLNRHWPHLLETPNPTLGFLSQTIKAQAELIAQWMSLGFIHGVMNTDNCSPLGLTIDYGPCAFMDDFSFEKAFSSIDRNKRYAYGQQPKIAYWNLCRLAEALAPLFDGKPEDITALLMGELSKFQSCFEQSWAHSMGQKLGFFFDNQSHLKPSEVLPLIAEWIELLESHKLDFTEAYQNVNLYFSDEHFCFNGLPNIRSFLEKVKTLVPPMEKNLRVQKLKKVNPVFIPRNHLIERAIQDAQNGDFSFFKEILNCLQNPFEKISTHENLYQPAMEQEKVQKTFCGT
jgi:uncharacterized protein YdiU (UPF0061 family)